MFQPVRTTARTARLTDYATESAFLSQLGFPKVPRAYFNLSVAQLYEEATRKNGVEVRMSQFDIPRG